MLLVILLLIFCSILNARTSPESILIITKRDYVDIKKPKKVDEVVSNQKKVETNKVDDVLLVPKVKEEFDILPGKDPTYEKMFDASVEGFLPPSSELSGGHKLSPLNDWNETESDVKIIPWVKEYSKYDRCRAPKPFNPWNNNMPVDIGSENAIAPNCESITDTEIKDAFEYSKPIMSNGYWHSKHIKSFYTIEPNNRNAAVPNSFNNRKFVPDTTNFYKRNEEQPVGSDVNL